MLSAPSFQAPRRFAFVGTGGRVKMFIDPIVERYRSEAVIAALCDSSLVRARYHQQRLQEKFSYQEVPIYSAGDFSRMLDETRPDEVVVCSVDSTHDRYIIASLHAGCDVITEKPMTIDAPRCQAIFDAVRQTGRKVRVAFNYRWAPGASLVKQTIASGIIGTVRQVNMEYLLNTSHGADYFRRWHAEKRNSGGLLVHKSTHHFDLVNWWTDSVPRTVFACGALNFYGHENAIKRGDEKLTGYPRYRGHVVDGDPFAYNYARSMTQDQAYEEALYLSAEAESGYVRDRNVFRTGIDIEDTMNVMVVYRSGMLLNYTLNAYSPYEGYRVTFTGDRGRLEYSENHGAHLLDDHSIGMVHLHSGEQSLSVFPHFKPAYQLPIPKVDGGHGGGDALLQEQLFARNPPVDPLGRSAWHQQGSASILVGIAANQSISSRQPVELESLVGLPPHVVHLSQLE